VLFEYKLAQGGSGWRWWCGPFRLSTCQYGIDMNVHLFDVNVHLTDVDLNMTVVNVNEVRVNLNGTDMNDSNTDMNDAKRVADANITNLNLHPTGGTRPVRM